VKIRAAFPTWILAAPGKKTCLERCCSRQLFLPGATEIQVASFGRIASPFWTSNFRCSRNAFFNSLIVCFSSRFQRLAAQQTEKKVAISSNDVLVNFQPRCFLFFVAS
jgi:hypothetical protein